MGFEQVRAALAALDQSAMFDRRELKRFSAQSAEARAAALQHGLQEVAARTKTHAIVQRVGTMFTTFFTELRAVRNWQDAKTCDTQKFGAFFRAMLERGVYLAPSQFEAAFLSTAHTDDDVAATIEAAGEALAVAVPLPLP